MHSTAAADVVHNTAAHSVVAVAERIRRLVANEAVVHGPAAIARTATACVATASSAQSLAEQQQQQEQEERAMTRQPKTCLKTMFCCFFVACCRMDRAPPTHSRPRSYAPSSPPLWQATARWAAPLPGWETRHEC